MDSSCIRILEIRGDWLQVLFALDGLELLLDFGDEMGLGFLLLFDLSSEFLDVPFDFLG